LTTGLAGQSVLAKVARDICTTGALGSPFRLSRLYRSLVRLSADLAEPSATKGSIYLAEVSREFFVSRDPISGYDLLKSRETANEVTEPDVFELCGRAISLTVFCRNWGDAAELFQKALHEVSATPIPYLHEAVDGLIERYFLLPLSGCGVRKQSTSRDLLWALNHAEQLFCQGESVEARKAAESIVLQHEQFGWARTLLIRILFAQGEFRAASSVLSSSEAGSIASTEELAWDTLLAGVLHGWQGSPTATQLARFGQLRLPLYFDGLRTILRGGTRNGLEMVETATRLAEPYALMRAHDPVLAFALQKARQSARCQPVEMSRTIGLHERTEQGIPKA